jgi:hypothetical protein
VRRETIIAATALNDSRADGCDRKRWSGWPTEAAIGLSIAVGIVCLVVGTIYLYSVVGPLGLQDVGQSLGS